MTWEKQEKLMTEETQGLNAQGEVNTEDVQCGEITDNTESKWKIFYKPIKMVQHTYQHFVAKEPDRCTNANIKIAYG